MMILECRWNANYLIGYSCFTVISAKLLVINIDIRNCICKSAPGGAGQSNINKHTDYCRETAQLHSETLI